MVRYSKEERAQWPEGHRPCTTCKKLLPYTTFHKHSACLDGVNVVCKDCRKVRSKKDQASLSTERRLFHAAKSRATARGIVFDITVQDVVVPNVCPVFGVPFEKGSQKWAASLDRINPDLGYIKGNVRVISNLANMMKSVASKEELATFSKWAQENKDE